MSGGLKDSGANPEQKSLFKEAPISAPDIASV